MRSALNRASPALVLVTGAPATGKTTLASRLSGELGWPLLSRDRVKELLWDALPEVERDASRDLVLKAQWPLFYALVAELLNAGVSVVAEGCVHSEWGVAELSPLTAQARTVLIHCETDRAESHRRFAGRATSSPRHPGHDDAGLVVRVAQNPDRWAHFEKPAPLGAPTLRVNTTSGLSPDFGSVLAFVRAQA